MGYSNPSAITKSDLELWGKYDGRIPSWKHKNRYVFFGCIYIYLYIYIECVSMENPLILGI